MLKKRTEADRKLLRERQQFVRTLNLPEGALARYRDLVDTFYGGSIDDVIRFALISWLHEHAATINATVDRVREQRRKDLEQL